MNQINVLYLNLSRNNLFKMLRCYKPGWSSSYETCPICAIRVDPGSNRDGAKTFSRENFRYDYAGLTLIQMSLNGKRNCVTPGSLENECHLQIKGTHNTNKAKYSR